MVFLWNIVTTTVIHNTGHLRLVLLVLGEHLLHIVDHSALLVLFVDAAKHTPCSLVEVDTLLLHKVVSVGEIGDKVVSLLLLLGLNK